MLSTPYLDDTQGFCAWYSRVSLWYAEGGAARSAGRSFGTLHLQTAGVIAQAALPGSMSSGRHKMAAPQGFEPR